MPPSIAAMVVIMIGRERSIQAIIDGVSRRLTTLAFRHQREVGAHSLNSASLSLVSVY
jgi:hypothetical protein